MTLNKTIRIGTMKENEKHSIFCKVQINDKGELSICGVEGPKRNGNCFGGCGQINEYIKDNIKTFAPGWNETLLDKFLAVWDRWHLNHMKPGCAHQREWDTTKKITVTDYTWSTEFHNLRRKAENGEMTEKEYADYCELAPKVHNVTIKPNRPKYETPEVKALLDAGMIKLDKTEEKSAGWVREEEHPDGLLCKKCPVCGYAYGSAWLKEELPQEVVDFLTALPETDQIPAWV
jgi:hypothetical protein